MANPYNLVRSFYGWLAKVERALKKSRRVFPQMHPTTIPGAFEVSEKVLPVVKGTEHQERAEYWNRTFKSIVESGWDDAR